MTRYMVGTGDHVYEVIHPFGKLPSGMTFGKHLPCGGRLLGPGPHLPAQGPAPVLVFDGDGNLLNTWGDGQILDAHGVYITPADDIFLLDRDAHELLKLDIEGKVLLRLGTRERPALHAPIQPPRRRSHLNGRGDFRRRWVRKLPRSPVFGRRRAPELMGLPGRWPGRAHHSPRHLGGRPRQGVCCDRENNRVQVFSVEGDYLAEWGDFFHPWTFLWTTKIRSTSPTRYPGSRCSTRMES